jgi:predicted lipoprotein with Yx(FWY)xxD motif
MEPRRTRTGVLVGAVLAAPALLLAACGGSTYQSSSGAASGSSSGSGPAKVATHGGPSGYLTDGSGRSVYLFESDHGKASTCNGACVSAWPPLTTTGAPQASAGVKTAMLGTITRSDGAKQVTYGGHPLYYYAGDSTAGQTNGEGLNGFGALWYLLSPSGATVQHVASTSGGTSSGGSGYSSY